MKGLLNVAFSIMQNADDVFNLATSVQLGQQTGKFFAGRGVFYNHLLLLKIRSQKTLVEAHGRAVWS